MNRLKEIPLDQCEKILLGLANSSTDLVVIADWKRTILYANRTVCDKTGFKQKDLVGARIPIFYRKENESKYTSQIFKELHESGSWAGELEVRKKDGTTFWTATTIFVYYNGDGKPAGTVGIGRDLTLERLYKQRCMEEQSQLKAIIESMEDAVCVCDPHGRIQMANNAHSRMLGYSKEEIVGVKPPYPWIDPVDRETLQIAFKRLEREGVLKNFPVTWRRRDNNRLNVSVAMSHLYDSSKHVIGRICAFRDVTNVRYADELRQANERIQRLVFDVKQKAVRLQTLEETNNLVLKNATSSRIFGQITAGVKKLVEHDLAGFYAYDAASGTLMPHTLSKQTPFTRKLAKFPLALGQGIIGEAAVLGKMVCVNNAHLDPRSKYPPGMKPEKEHFIAVPLKGRHSIFGVLVVSRNRDPEFIEEEALVVKSLADAATVALENVRLFQSLSTKGQ